MKKNKITSLILVFFLFGCSSIKSIPTFASTPVNTPQPLESPSVLSTPSALPTVLENVASEITTAFKDNQIIISGFQPTIIRWLHWSKDGKTLLIGTQENGVTIYDVVNKRATLNFDNGMIIQNLELSPDEKYLAVVVYATDSIRLLNPETGELIKTLPVTYYWPGSLAFSPDSRLLAAINTRDGKIFLWDIASGKEIKQLIKGDNELGRLLFTPDGTLLMISATGHSCKVWDTNTWEIRRRFSGECGRFTFSPDDDNILTSSSETHTLAVWDFNSGKKLFTLSISQPRITATAYDLSGKYIAVSGANGGNSTIKNSITIFDANTGKYLRELPLGYYAQAIALAFNPDGTQLASVSQEEGSGAVIIWNINQP
jgi:WD40 repeat protein